MKVSVIMLTYEHSPYIRCAINSVLMQQTDFNFEVLVVDDYSQDGTRDVLREYERRFPDRIRLILPERNECSNFRTQQAIETSEADYIACIDGDDCWISPHKLQTLADVMDGDPQCAIAFHNVVRFWQDGDRLPALNNCPRRLSATLNFEVLLLSNVVAGCAPLLRRAFMEEFPDWYENAMWGDWPLYIICASHGHLRFISELMGGYRRHQNGYWAGLREEDQLDQIVHFLRTIDSQLDHAWSDAIEANIAYWKRRRDALLKRGAVEARSAASRDEARDPGPSPLAGVSVPAGLMLGLGYDPQPLLDGVDFTQVDRTQLSESIAKTWRAGVFASAATDRLNADSKSTYYARALDYARWLGTQSGQASTSDCQGWVVESSERYPVTADPCISGRCTGWAECRKSLPSNRLKSEGSIR